MAGKRPKEELIQMATSADKAAPSARRPVATKNTSKKTKRNKRPPRAVRLSQAERRYRPAAPQRHGVSVTVHFTPLQLPAKLTAQLGRLRLPATVRSRLPELPPAVRPYARQITLIAVILLVGAGGAAIYMVHGRQITPTAVAAPAERTAPDFKPLVPSAAEASASSYDGKRNLVMYSTTFSGARLAVSQQALPATFLHDPMALKTAADSISAKQELDTAAGPLYIATNDTNDQMAIYAGKKVLLFIHTDRKLDDASWKSFIELLKEK